MAWYDKYVPKELKKGADELLDFGSSVIEKGITKPFASLSDKLIPNELRFLAPYAAGIGTLMLPPGMSMMTRALLASMMNAGGQIAADESATGELSDLNKLSMAIAGGLGALGSQDVTKGGASGKGIRGGIDTGERFAMQGADAGEFIGAGQDLPGTTGFLQGAENVGREGIGTLSDYVQGTRSTLADIGKNPGSLFQKNVPGKKNFLGMKKTFPVLQDAAAALTPTATLGTADLAYEAAIDAQNAFDAQEAEELRQAGLSESEIMLARRNAITEAMTDSLFSDEDINATLEELGLLDFAQGGIASLKDGGMLDFGGNEMDYRGGGFIPMGSKERADDVPARLSKNEFVMTADAVRAAGGGSVNKGAQRMYDIMNRLEAQV